MTAVPDPRIRHSISSGHFSSTKPAITSSSNPKRLMSKRSIVGKNSRPANTNKMTITELKVTAPIVN